MKIIILLFLILSACQKSEDSKPSSNVDPIYGNWIYKYESSSISAKGIYAELNSDGSLFLLHSYFDISSHNNSVKMYYRLNKGNYTRDGEKFTFNYSYETCNKIGSETILLSIDSKNSDRLFAKMNDTTIITLNRTHDSNTKSDLTITAIEDKDCKILAKIEKSQNRLPASKKNKSFFDRVVK